MALGVDAWSVGVAVSGLGGALGREALECLTGSFHPGLKLSVGALEPAKELCVVEPGLLPVAQLFVHLAEVVLGGDGRVPGETERGEVRLG